MIYGQQDSGGEIPFDFTVIGGLSEQTRLNLWTFDGLPGDRITITMKRLSGTLTPYFSLLDPTGLLMTVGSSTGQEARVADIWLSRLGTYTIIAQLPPNSLLAGDYELKLERTIIGFIPTTGGGAMTYDQRVSASLWADNVLERYTFTGNPGDAIDLTLTRITRDEFRVMMRLFDPQGIFVASHENNIKTTLQKRGQYTIEVMVTAGSGNYEMSLLLQTSGLQHDAGGGEIDYDMPYIGAIWGENMADQWYFVAEAGDTIDMTVMPSEPPRDSNQFRVRLVNTNGEILRLVSYDSSARHYHLSQYVVPATDTYWIWVIGSMPTAFMDYTLQVTQSGARIQSTDMALVLGERRISSILPENPVDVWQFDGQQGDQINVIATPLAPALRVYLSVLSSDDVLLFTTTRNSYTAEGITRLNITLPQTDTYQIIAHADPADLKAVGNYVLRTEITQTGDSRAVRNGGGQLLIGETVTGAISNTDPDDIYRLYLAQPATLTFAMTRVDGNLNGYLEILDEEGVVLASDDDSAGGLNPIISNLSLSEGHYHIVVRRPDNDTLSQGRYTLIVSLTP